MTWVAIALGGAYLMDGPQTARFAGAEPGARQTTRASDRADHEIAALPELGNAPVRPMAVPPLVVPEPEPIELPALLSDADVALYKEIFTLQVQSKWQVADYLVEKLEDKRLIGYVLAQRYLHPTGYRSSYNELRAWLAKYADLPGSDKVYKLAISKRPSGAILPRRPAVRKESLAELKLITRPPYKSRKRLSRSQRTRVRQLQGRIHRHLGRSELSLSEKYLDDPEVKRLFDQVQLDDAHANVAAGWLYYGNHERADRIVSQAALRSGHEVPLANWMAGLAAWRLGDFERAARHFEGYARGKGLSRWKIAAGAYWAARAHWRVGDRQEVDRWLSEAAKHSRTFYGLIARYRLGQEPDFSFEPWEFDDGDAASLQSNPEGARALAFMQLGDIDRAERELMAIEGWDDRAIAKGILTIAEAAQLPSLSVRLAVRLVDGGYADWTVEELDRPLYPIPPWKPKGAFRVDRALVYAVMRQESQFKRWAKSPDGARGLMQLMPATAAFLARRRFTGRAIYELYDPALNIDLGQRYLAQLLKHPRVQGDLFRLAVAYNGGPGNLGKWSRRITGDDPLLFIESLPTKETRVFIERVLTNFWIYRARLGQPTPSLAAVAAGYWPGYQALDGGTAEIGSPLTRIEVQPKEEAEAWRSFGVF